MFNIQLIPLTFCLTTFIHCSIAIEQQQTANDNDLKTQESLDTFGGALGPLRAHLEPMMLLKNGPTTAYDDYHKYGGIGGQKLLLAPIAHLTSHDGSSLMDGYKNYYGDSEYLDQGLNKYSGHHKRDKYGAKSDTHKDFHDTHVYTRNRGYGYEKHYMFDKEYSTGKKVGTNKGKHSFFGDHDHGSKYSIDAHKNYDSKKYGNKNLATVDPYEPIGIISNNHHNDYSMLDDHIDQGLSDHGFHDGGKTNLLNKHKKELHKIKKHFENHHHIHHAPKPIAYAKVHEYIPVIESYGGVVPTSVPSTSTYGTHSLIEPYEHKYYPQSAYSIQPIHQSPESSLYDDTLYLSSASDDRKTNQYIKPNMDTEGESVNTLNARLLSTSQPGSTLSTSSSSALPTSSSIPVTTAATKSAKIINTAPLISTRLMPIVDGSAASLSSSTSTSTTTTLSTLTSPRIALTENSFPKIQSAVHATPAIIATHMYKH